ncbi:MAG: radical SAM protein [Thermodesulfobacteriota bacterium]
MKVLLLNPPGKNLYLRDYYCSKISKANYINQPTDLLILSGIINQEHHTVVLDAIIENLNDWQTLSIIKALAPDVIVFLTGSVSFAEDLRFLEQIKQMLPVRLIGTGDIFMEDTAALLEKYPCIDAALLDFTSDAILQWIDNSDGPHIVYRRNGKVESPQGKSSRTFKIPRPRHDLFKNRLYRYPFCKREPFATVLTSYGCPYKCNFCIMANLPFKMRPVADVIEELAYLKSLGIKEIYFNDQTFGINRARTADLLNRMVPLDLTWVCFSRVDLVDADLLNLMKRAGCHTIMFGVESGNQEILASTGKEINKADIMTAFTGCRKLAINTVGTFIIGLPGDTVSSCLDTIEFAKMLPCDYASFNVPVPRMKTKLRDYALKKGLIGNDLMIMDQSGHSIPMQNEFLTKRQIEELHKRAYREFYLRPTYLLRRLLKIRTLTQLKNHLREGAALFASKGI